MFEWNRTKNLALYREKKAKKGLIGVILEPILAVYYSNTQWARKFKKVQAKKLVKFHGIFWGYFLKVKNINSQYGKY